jgi:hypothetical protein
MFPLYIGALILGGILIAASILLGGGDDSDFDNEMELDKDFDLNVDKDFDLNADKDFDIQLDGAEDVDSEGWLPFLSMRFWTFALACFGMSGSLMSMLGTSDILSAPIAAVTGITLGWIVAYIFHRLKNDVVSSETSISTYINHEGQALLPISKNKMGKIRLSLGTEVVDLRAVTNDPTPIHHSEKIIVISVADGIATVSSMLPQSQKQRLNNAIPKKEL